MFVLNVDVCGSISSFFVFFTFLYWIILDLDYRVAKIPQIVSCIPLTELLLMLILYIDIIMAHVSKLRHKQWCSTSRVHVCMLSHFSHVWLCNPMDCSLPASSVYEIFQARILEGIVMPCPRGSSWPRDWTHVFCISCIYPLNRLGSLSKVQHRLIKMSNAC